VQSKLKICERQLVLKRNWDIISWLEKGEQIADICHNVRHAHSSTCTVCDNADRMQENAKCLDNIKCQQSEAGSVV